MDVFLISLIAIGGLVLFGAFCVATKNRNDGCLPLVLLVLLMLAAVATLAFLR